MWNTRRWEDVCVLQESDRQTNRPRGSAPRPHHSLRATHTMRSELVHVKQPVSDFVEEQWKQWKHRVSLVSAAQWSEQKMQVVGTELDFLFPPPLGPALTLINKHFINSYQDLISTWSNLEFVRFSPEFIGLHLNIMKNDSWSTFCAQTNTVLCWTDITSKIHERERLTDCLYIQSLILWVHSLWENTAWADSNLGWCSLGPSSTEEQRVMFDQDMSFDPHI